MAAPTAPKVTSVTVTEKAHKAKHGSFSAWVKRTVGPRAAAIVPHAVETGEIAGTALVSALAEGYANAKRPGKGLKLGPVDARWVLTAGAFIMGLWNPKKINEHAINIGEGLLTSMLVQPGVKWGADLANSEFPLLGKGKEDPPVTESTTAVTESTTAAPAEKATAGGVVVGVIDGSGRVQRTSRDRDGRKGQDKGKARLQAMRKQIVQLMHQEKDLAKREREPSMFPRLQGSELKSRLREGRDDGEKRRFLPWRKHND